MRVGGVVPGAGGTVQVKVESSDGKTSYTVRCLPGAVWTCWSDARNAPCPGYENKGICRHIKLVRGRLTQSVPVAGDLL